VRCCRSTSSRLGVERVRLARITRPVKCKWSSCFTIGTFARTSNDRYGFLYHFQLSFTKSGDLEGGTGSCVRCAATTTQQVAVADSQSRNCDDGCGSSRLSWGKDQVLVCMAKVISLVCFLSCSEAANWVLLIGTFMKVIDVAFFEKIRSM
jgi:hypothetical protein